MGVWEEDYTDFGFNKYNKTMHKHAFEIPQNIEIAQPKKENR